MTRPQYVRSCMLRRVARGLAIAGALGTLALAGCARAPGGAVRAVGGAGNGPGTVAVEAVSVLPGGTSAGDAFTSFLAPSVDAPVIARSDGIVSEVRVHEGQRVAPGTVLARLDDDEQRLEVDYMGALSQQADAELERAEKGAQGQFVSRQILDAARAKARAAKADLDLARLALARRTLKAPVAGVVWQVRAVAHRPVKTADVLFRVTDPRRLEAELQLPAALNGRVHVGDAARLVPDGGAAPVAATVREVSPLVDPATARFRVVLATTAASASLVGQPVRVELLGHGGAAAATGSAGSTSAGAVLPRDAYLERAGDGLFALRLDHGHAHRVAVELGALRADGYEVLSGLSAGDLVLADGAAAVPADGAAVSASLRASGR
jgi:membrane fusion protein (multidrug efflux system)